VGQRSSRLEKSKTLTCSHGEEAVRKKYSLNLLSHNTVKISIQISNCKVQIYNQVYT